MAYICITCGKEFFTDWRHASRTPVRFCSPHCSRAFSSRKTRNKTKKVVCVECGECFEEDVHSAKKVCKKCEENQKIKARGITRIPEESLDGKCCNYCGQQAFFILKSGKFCCSFSANKCAFQRNKNREGLKEAYRSGEKSKKNFSEKERLLSAESQRLRDFEYHLSQVPQVFKKNSSFITGYPKKEIYCYLKGFSVPVCEGCGITEWRGSPITIELHHIDGDKTNNTLENLQLLCPNCHSQTENWRGRKNRKNAPRKKKVVRSDEEYIKALRTHRTIAEALYSMGLERAESSYMRARTLMEKYNFKVGEDIKTFKII